MNEQIKASELRIGNYVWGVSDRIECISELQRDKVETTFRGHLYNYSLYADISPIELTPEIFNKAGFEWDEVMFSKGRIMLSERKDGEWAVWYGTLTHGRIDDCNISYLHQLQNLYFALTNKELSITF